MEKKNALSVLPIILVIVFMIFNNKIQSQTAGTLTFNFTTVSSGGYTPKNCIAVWIETNSGTFVKTKMKYCSNSNLDHLNTWTGKSGSNVVDAVTGSTRTSNGALSVVWNGTDINTAIVADGIYKIWVEFAWASSMTTGKIIQSFTFNKGVTTDHQTPADLTNFTGITLDWSPAVGIVVNQIADKFSISPNPITNQSRITYTLTSLSDVTISLFDISGKLLNVLYDENQISGTYSLDLSIADKLKPGIYFVKMNTGKTEHISRIVISE